MIIAGASETNRDQMSRLLASSGFSVYRCCASASSLRRALSESDDSIIIYIGIIPDCTPDELILDYGSRIQVLWIARQNVLESCDSPEIFRLTLPATLLSVGRQGLFFIPAILLLPQWVGLRGVEMAQATADLLTFLLTIPFALWITRKLTNAAKHSG